MLLFLSGKSRERGIDYFVKMMGIGQIDPRFWIDESKDAVYGIRDLLGEYATHIGTSTGLRFIARFLALPCCDLVHIDAIGWVLEVAKTLSAEDDLSGEAAEECGKFAVVAWKHRQAKIEADPMIRISFRALVDLLAGHHAASAVNLLNGMGPRST
jgi:hypothetical protein